MYRIVLGVLALCAAVFLVTALAGPFSTGATAAAPASPDSAHRNAPLRICPLPDAPAESACSYWGDPYNPEQLPAAFTLDPAGLDACPGRSELLSLARAARIWSTVDCSSFSFGFAGFDDGASGLWDGVQYLEFDALDPGFAAASFLFGPPREVDLVFTSEELWQCAGGDVSLLSVALHEMGHALVLGHSSDPGSIMSPYYTGKESLSAGDRECLCDLYPAP